MKSLLFSVIIGLGLVGPVRADWSYDVSHPLEAYQERGSNMNLACAEFTGRDQQYPPIQISFRPSQLKVFWSDGNRTYSSPIVSVTFRPVFDTVDKYGRQSGYNLEMMYMSRSGGYLHFFRGPHVMMNNVYYTCSESDQAVAGS